MGLLDGLLRGQWTDDPEKNQAITQGLLNAGLQLMQTRGRFGPGLGQAGMAGLQGFNQVQQQQHQQKLQKAQLEAIERKKMLDAREDTLANLPSQFARPSPPTVDATGGMETAQEATNNYVPPSLDLQALAQKYLTTPGGLQTGLALQSSLKKQGPQFQSLAPGSKGLFIDPSTGRVVSSIDNPKEDTEKESPLARLMAEQAKFPPGSAQWKKYEQAIDKAATHQPPVSLNNYGTPLPIALEGGGTGYLQPPTRPGGPSQVLTIPGTGKAAVKPGDAKEKDLTESQAKATAFLGQMRSASGALKEMGFDQSSLSLQAETALAGGNVNIAISQKAQRVRQAQDQWAEAFLRFKTGAASTKDEVAANRKTFFPTIGDGPETVAQKAQMRAQAERDMEIAAGRGTGQLNARDGVKPAGNVLRFDAQGNPIK